MIKFIAAIVIFEVFVFAEGKECPAKYKKFSENHSFCKAPNSACKFLTRGVKEDEKAEILKTHNKLRSKVASGKETAAGGLPKASNMLEMVWDAEIAEIAQRHAEQCKFGHDCGTCRRVEAFQVGQNVKYSMYSCRGKCEAKKPDWNASVAFWYSEVEKFNKSLVSSLSPEGFQGVGHFTQVVWAETYKVGCGYVAFEKDGAVEQLYVCNYGPAGNMMKSALYKEGSPCSACPENSCCNAGCNGQETYPDLCHLKGSPNQAAY